jgi:uncharacterized alpha/beta hydrolase family protein
MKKIFLLLSLLLLTSCSQPTTATKQTEVTEQTEAFSEEDSFPKSTIPTLFIHGYSGGKNSFGPLIQRMEETGFAKKELTVTVLADGTLQTEGQLTGKENIPMIQVLFEDNQSHEWNQAEWIRSVLVYLKTNAQIDQVNIVGHSMGGVSTLRYLGTYSQDDSVPIVRKFSAIGAPFNDFVDTSKSQSIDDLLAHGPNEISARMKDYSSMFSDVALPSIQLLAGQLASDDLSDGTVPLGSALAIYHLLKIQNADISYTIITENAQHSQLHENAEVDTLLQQFLWGN